MSAVFVCEICKTKCGYDRVERRVELREAHSGRRLKTNKVADLCGKCAREEVYASTLAPNTQATLL